MFVIYQVSNTALTKVFPGRYKTERAARTAITRAYNDGKIKSKSEYAVADMNVYYDSIERKVTKKNLITGVEFETSINTPPSCDPSCETYWSM